jgi:hypothetical protein
MSQTLFLHRLIVICPAARFASVGTWWQNNIDAADNLSTWPSLNPTGLPTDPETHRWCSTALTEAQCRAVLVQVCNLAVVTPPTLATWNGWTRAEKQSWLVSTRAQLFTNTGIWLDLSDGDGIWNSPEAVLVAAGGLKKRQ